MLFDQSALESERSGSFGIAMPRGLYPLGQPVKEVDDGQHDPTLPLREPHSTGEGMPTVGAAGHSIGFGYFVDKNRKSASHAAGL